MKPPRFQLHGGRSGYFQPVQLSHPHHVARQIAFVDLESRCRGSPASHKAIPYSTLIPESQVDCRVRTGSQSRPLIRGIARAQGVIYSDLRSIRRPSPPASHKKGNRQHDFEGTKSFFHTINHTAAKGASFTEGLPPTLPAGNVVGSPDPEAPGICHLQHSRQRSCRRTIPSPSGSRRVILESAP